MRLALVQLFQSFVETKISAQIRTQYYPRLL
jgi:hypothetical protein